MESINNKVWKLKDFDEEYISLLTKNFDLSDTLAKILSHKVKDINHVFDFLTPKIKNTLPDPFHLLDMEKASSRLIKAIINKEKICIFADYDVDGATSAALLKKFLNEFEINPIVYVPNRITEGYGLMPFAVKKIQECGASLIITVDCGTSSHEGVKFAKDCGIDVVVIDHHLSPEIPREAFAVVNPNRIDENSEYTYLAAVGVCFLYIVAITKKIKEEDCFKDFVPPNLMEYLDLVALGTVCDVMKINGLNRAFVNAGLKIINLRKNIGINALLDASGVNEKITPYHLGFVIGPRINAGGRVGEQILGANLLSSTCEAKAKIIAGKLNDYNKERKFIEEQIQERAMEIAKSQANEPFIFIANTGWHEGVIGIVASRIKEKYNKPVAVVAINQDICKASCRSVPNLDFGSKLINAKTKNLILSGGGHAMAAGFTAEKDKLEDLKNYLNESFANDLEKFPASNRHEYYMDLSTSSVNMGLMDELSKLEPYGNGNHEPIFRFSKLFVLKANVVGDKHISCLLAPDKSSYGTKAIRAVSFNAVGSNFESALMHKYPRPMCFIGNLKVNYFQNSSYIQLHVKDIIISRS